MPRGRSGDLIQVGLARAEGLTAAVCSFSQWFITCGKPGSVFGIVAGSWRRASQCRAADEWHAHPASRVTPSGAANEGNARSSGSWRVWHVSAISTVAFGSLNNRQRIDTGLSSSNVRHYQPFAATSTLGTGRAIAVLQISREADAHLPQSPAIAVDGDTFRR